MKVSIRKDALEFMITHGIREYPKEACGILGGCRKNSLFIVEKVWNTKNISSSPQKNFFIDPIDEVRIFRILEKEKLDFIGVYHTHPEGSLFLSDLDIENLYLELCYIIISLNFLKDIISLELKAFLKDENGIINLPIEIF